jgi:hypothetical protein
MTQRELASLAAVSPSEIEKAEGGSWLPELEVVVRLPGSLEVTVERLLDGVVWEPTGNAPRRFNISQL